LESSEAFVDRFCEEAGIVVEWEIGEKAWRAAATAFQGYAARRRKQKGAEARRILADFVIGAHALVNGYKLLTLDARMYEASFPKLPIRSL
jgi:predicted nucleic acid-binding protein